MDVSLPSLFKFHNRYRSRTALRFCDISLDGCLILSLGESHSWRPHEQHLCFPVILACAVPFGSPAAPLRKVKPAKIGIRRPGACATLPRVSCDAGRNSADPHTPASCRTIWCSVAPRQGDAVVAQAMALGQGFAKGFHPPLRMSSCDEDRQSGLSETLKFNVPVGPASIRYYARFPVTAPYARDSCPCAGGRKLEAPVVEK